MARTKQPSRAQPAKAKLASGPARIAKGRRLKGGRKPGKKALRRSLTPAQAAAIDARVVYIAPPSTASEADADPDFVPLDFGGDGEMHQRRAAGEMDDAARAAAHVQSLRVSLLIPPAVDMSHTFYFENGDTKWNAPMESSQCAGTGKHARCARTYSAYTRFVLSLSLSLSLFLSFSLDCAETIMFGCYCPYHERTLCDLQVGESSVSPGHNGLYTTVPLKAGDIIGRQECLTYDGAWLSNYATAQSWYGDFSAPDDLPHRYMICLMDKHFIDCSTSRCTLSWIVPVRLGSNVTGHVVRVHTGGHTVHFMANKDIKAGAELFRSCV